MEGSYQYLCWFGRTYNLLKFIGSLVLAAGLQGAVFQIPPTASFGLLDDGLKDALNGGLTTNATGTAVNPGGLIDGVKVWGVFTIDPIFDADLGSSIITGSYFAFASSTEAFTLPAGVSIPVDFLFDITGPGAWGDWTIRFVLRQAETNDEFSQTFSAANGTGTRPFSGSGSVVTTGGEYIGWTIELLSGNLNEAGSELDPLVINVPATSWDFQGTSLGGAIPEPGTAWGVGGALLGAWMWRRRSLKRAG